MKITYTTNARIPTEKAHGYQITKMCEEYSDLGNELDLVLPGRKNKIKEDLFKFYGIKNNFSVHFIKFPELLFRLKGKYKFTILNLFFYFKLFFLSIDKSVIIYTRNPEAAWIFKLRGYRVVYECHDWFGSKKNIALKLLKKVDYIITTNNFIKNNFLKEGFDGDKLLVAPNGVDVDKFIIDISKNEAIDKLSFDDNLKNKMKETKVLLYTGSYKTMGVDKGIDEILGVLKLLDNSFIFLAVGGHENDIKYYKNKAEELGVGAKTFFKDRYSHDELALIQKASDLLLMPFPDKAHYRYHMTPLKMFEYMCSDRLIIASDLPSIKEILNEKNALFCKPGDVQDLFQKINLAFGDTELREKLSRQALLDVKEFSWKKRAEKIIKFINKNNE